MKQPRNKFIAVSIYFAPYIIAVVCIVLYACLVNVFRALASDGMVFEQDVWSNLLTYAPISIAFIIVAIVVNKLIRAKIDLSIIGIKQTEKNAKSGIFSFLMIAVCIICAVVSIGFACSYSYLEIKQIKGQVGGSPSYYVVDTGFMGFTPSKTVISEDIKWEYADGMYTISLSNGKQYRIKKDTKAGKAFSELVNF